MKELDHVAKLLGSAVPERTLMVLPASDSEPLVVICGDLTAEVQQISDDSYWFRIRHRQLAGAIESGKTNTFIDALRRVMISVEASRLLEKMNAA